MNTYRFGYQIIFGKYHPAKYLEYARLVEKHGFDSIWVGDHFHPWFHTGASGGSPWVWLTIAAERTTRIRIGTAVTTPIFRYHPAIIAQTFATLEELYPSRIVLGLGTGEAMNEVVTGHPWPPYRERLERLEEAVRVIRLLWTKDFVTFDGKYFKLKNANLYLKPKRGVPIYMAAHGPKIAELAGKYADGLITVAAVGASKILLAFNKGGEKSGRNLQCAEKVLTVAASYDEDYEKAMKHCKRFAHTLIPHLYSGEVCDPRELEKYTSTVSEKDIAEKWIVSSSVDEHIERIEMLFRKGFNHVDISNRSPDEEKLVRAYGKRVIPYFRESGRGRR